MTNNDDLAIFTPKSWIVAKHIIAEIKSGEYNPGEKLASIRKLAEKYNVGRQVVTSAFDLLAKSNYIYTEVGRGTFVNPDIKIGRFYRMGIFINNYNPIWECDSIKAVNSIAVSHGYNLIMGSNFEEDWDLKSWLAKKQDLDGVIVTGIVEDKTLAPLIKQQLPYVVAGNYDISDTHPQVTVNLCNNYRDKFIQYFKGKTWQKIALLIGPTTLRADREITEGFKAALNQLGLPLHKELICHTNSNGYPEMAYLADVSDLRPDAIYVHGDYIRGVQKFYQAHPEKRTTKILVNSNSKKLVHPSCYDDVVNVGNNSSTYMTKAAKKLLKLIEHDAE